MDKQYYYALSFVNTDSKGIVADTTKVLFDNGFNLSDSSSTLLQGVFSMIFIVTNDKEYKEQEIKDAKTEAEPVIRWIKESPQTVRALEQLLGEVRKAEKYNSNRHYTNKTDILDGIDERRERKC